MSSSGIANSAAIAINTSGAAAIVTVGACCDIIAASKSWVARVTRELGSARRRRSLRASIARSDNAATVRASGCGNDCQFDGNVEVLADELEEANLVHDWHRDQPANKKCNSTNSKNILLFFFRHALRSVGSEPVCNDQDEGDISDDDSGFCVVDGKFLRVRSRGAITDGVAIDVGTHSALQTLDNGFRDFARLIKRVARCSSEIVIVDILWSESAVLRNRRKEKI